LTITIALDDARAQDPAVAGRKAAVLAKLLAVGFPIPDGFVVPAGADLPTTLADLPGGGSALERFAVRSSAAAEDRSDASFAGQYETLLDVTQAELEGAIVRVRASAGSNRIRSYATDAERNGIAVLVQRMLHPRAAGVAFTADPINGNRDVTLVTAVPGLGESLVGGQVGGESWRVKDRHVVSEARGHARIAEILTNREVEAIASLARRVEAVFGIPQDIEWAIDGPTLWLLQARAMTALPDAVSWDPPVPGAFSCSFRLGEWIGAPVTPLFEDWLLGRLEHRLHERHAEWVGMRGIRPYHVVLNGWYFYSLEFLPITLRGTARSLPGMLARLVRTPRRVAVAFPQVARFGVPLYEREWREDLLPRYQNAVRDAALAVGQTPLDELPGIIDQLADIAGDYFASMAIVAGYAYKAEVNFAYWYRWRLGKLGESHCHYCSASRRCPSSRPATSSRAWTGGIRPSAIGRRRSRPGSRARILPRWPHVSKPSGSRRCCVCIRRCGLSEAGGPSIGCSLKRSTPLRSERSRWARSRWRGRSSASCSIALATRSWPQGRSTPRMTSTS
jgi:rifampicin phosphotransferase